MILKNAHLGSNPQLLWWHLVFLHQLGYIDCIYLNTQQHIKIGTHFYYKGQVVPIVFFCKDKSVLISFDIHAPDSSELD